MIKETMKDDERLFGLGEQTPTNCDCAKTSFHPALERFTIIASSPAPSTAKACFMEPERICVNSGACEMRGF